MEDRFTVLDCFANAKGGFPPHPWGDGTIDGRDLHRLLDFFSWDEICANPKYRALFKEDATGEGWGEPKSWTVEAVTAQLIRDATFGKEKAENERGISSSTMHSVCLMWLWVLGEDDIRHWEYGGYGLSVFNAILEKYGTPEAVNA